MRNVALARVLRLMRRLEGMHYAPPLKALADEFRVHPRTIRRDLLALESAGHRVPAWRLTDKPFVELSGRGRAREMR